METQSNSAVDKTKRVLQKRFTLPVWAIGLILIVSLGVGSVSSSENMKDKDNKIALVSDERDEAVESADRAEERLSEYRERTDKRIDALEAQVDELTPTTTTTTTTTAPPETTAPPVTSPARTSPPRTNPPTTSYQAPSAYYSNCTEARNAGVTPIRRGEPGYAPHLDRDNDGIACE